MEESVTLFPTWGGGGVAVQRQLSLGDFFWMLKSPCYVLKEVPKQNLCSLLASNMLDIASISMLKTSCTIYCISVADTRKCEIHFKKTL